MKLTARPLTAKAFAPYGDLLDCSGKSFPINAGLCQRHHDLAKLDFSDGSAAISLFKAEPRSLPYTVDLMERHPLGSQAFIPMSEHPFLVIAARDAGGRPATPEAFLTAPHQGINFHKNTWHGVLTPLHAPGLFAVVDYVGSKPNLEEYKLPAPYLIST